MWLWTDVAETNNFYSSLNVVILNSLLVSHWIRVHVCGYQLDVHIHHTQSIQDFNWMRAIIIISTGQRTNSSMCQ